MLSGKWSTLLAPCKSSGSGSLPLARAGALSHGGRWTASLLWPLSFCGGPVGSLAYPSVLRRSVCPPRSLCAGRAPRPLDPGALGCRAPGLPRPLRGSREECDRLRGARRWGVRAAWVAELLLSLPGPDLSEAQDQCDVQPGVHAQPHGAPLQGRFP